MRAISLLMIMMLSVSACVQRQTVSVNQHLVDEAAWESSIWISAADAPVVTGAIRGKNFRAADGASWFVSTLKNDRKVVSAYWMTAGLGVYDIYVNGRLVGEEVLKPGFTHNYKTKYSFT